MFRVLLVDDHEAVRVGLRTALLSRNEISEVFECSGSDNSCTEHLQKAPDVVVLDMQLGEGRAQQPSGIDLLSQIRADNLATRVVVLSAFASEGYIWQSLQAGISGYILKSDPLDSIIDNILSVAKGNDGIFSARVLSVMTRSRHSGKELTPRELEILALLHLPNAEIAKQLHVTENTVKKHVTQILSKTNAQNRASAQKWAWEHNFIERF